MQSIVCYNKLLVYSHLSTYFNFGCYYFSFIQKVLIRPNNTLKRFKLGLEELFVFKVDFVWHFINILANFLSRPRHIAFSNPFNSNRNTFKNTVPVFFRFPMISSHRLLFNFHLPYNFHNFHLAYVAYSIYKWNGNVYRSFSWGPI